MSHVDSLLSGIEQTIIEKEKMTDDELQAEATEKKKYSVTARLDCMHIQYLDMLAKKVDMSRSALLAELGTSALMDIMEKMGVTQKFFDNLVGQTTYDKEGIKNV